MNWKFIRPFPWIDTRTIAVRNVPKNGRVLDIGTSDGSTLRHFYELRPDLVYHAADINQSGEKLPPECTFARLDITREKIPFPDNSLDCVMAMHLIEHLHEWDNLINEVLRVLKPGGFFYLEFPHKKTAELPSAEKTFNGHFTFNFYDDPTHINLPDVALLTKQLEQNGFSVIRHGISRNLLFALS